MDYEKGKKIEDCVYKLKQITGYYGEKEMDINKLHGKLYSIMEELAGVIGEEV